MRSLTACSADPFPPRTHGLMSYSNISYFEYDDPRLELVYGPKDSIISITTSEYGSYSKNTIRTKYQTEGTWNSLYLETFMISNYKYLCPQPLSVSFVVELVIKYRRKAQK